MANSALLVMDVQRDVVAIADDGSGYLPRLRRAIDGARAAGVTVIYVVLGLRPGDPEVSPPQQGDDERRAGGPVHRGPPGTEIHDDVAPQPGDIVVTKRRGGSAFSGSDLDLVLRLAVSTALFSPASPPALWCCPPCGAPSTWTSA